MSVRLIYPIAALIGGVLPLVLTVRLGIHTERYLLQRLAAVAIAGVVINPVLSSLSNAVLYLICYIGICAAEILYEVLKIRDFETTGA